MSFKIAQNSSVVALAILASVLATVLIFVPAADAQQGVLRDGAILDSIETPYGTIYKIHRARPGKSIRATDSPSFDGDTFSFQHQLGALIDGIFKCFSEHQANMTDNTVAFDGLSELLDPYLDGTQPLIFEFETPGNNLVGGEKTTDVFMNSFGDGDLFPEGFMDPETGTPLNSACIEVGIDDTLDSDVPSQVNSATFEASNSDGSVLPPIDISSLFENPFDGRISLVFDGLAGEGIDGTILEMNVKNAPDPNAIFADGFESGDATSWTDQVP